MNGPRFMLVLALVLLVAPVRAADSLVHKGPAATFTVTADGLSSIKIGDIEVAAGGWYAWNAGPTAFNLGKSSKAGVYGGYYVRDVAGQIAKQLKDKTLTVIGPSEARVRHVLGDLACTYTYRFDGDDVRIAARLENNSQADEVTVPAFGGLRFQFAQPPRGQMTVWHPSYLRHIGLDAMHPSHPSRIGGSYASDGKVGIGLSPAGPDRFPRTLFLWDFDDWNPARREAVPVRWLAYMRGEPLAPGSAATFHMILRAAATDDWKRLLEPYKAHFLRTYGPVRYNADHRAVAMACVNHSPGAIKPDNPYGLHGDFRRLDLPEMAAKFVDVVGGGLTRANGQGVLIWGQTGQEPRGEMYRTDFDVLPGEIERNWRDVLARRFHEAHLHIGAAARPGEVTYRRDWRHDGTMPLGDRAEHIEMVARRFEAFGKLGADMYYLDSFGSHPNDVKIMMALRERLGPDIQTFCEHQCDAIVPFSGMYSETDFRAKGSGGWDGADQYVPRSGLWFIQFCRWMLGEDKVNVVSRLYEIKGKIPEGFEPPLRFFYRNHITPLIADYQVKAQADEVRKLQEEHLSADGKKWTR